MPAFHGNNELALHVANPDAAAEFHQRVLGGRLVERTHDVIEIANGALRLFLVRDTTRVHASVVPSFDVPDRSAALAYLQAVGCTLVPVGPHSPADVYVRDPSGIVFDVVERPVKGSSGDLTANS